MPSLVYNLNTFAFFFLFVPVCILGKPNFPSSACLLVCGTINRADKTHPTPVAHRMLHWWPWVSQGSLELPPNPLCIFTQVTLFHPSSEETMPHILLQHFLIPFSQGLCFLFSWETRTKQRRETHLPTTTWYHPSTGILTHSTLSLTQRMECLSVRPILHSYRKCQHAHLMTMPLDYLLSLLFHHVITFYHIILLMYG